MDHEQGGRSSKERRRLQELVNRRVESVLRDAGDDPLSELTSRRAPPAPFAAHARSESGADTVLKGFHELPVDRIAPSPFQPRRHDSDEADEELARSVAEQGVLTPVLVRPLGQDRYELIAGERRWRAARRAGLVTVPARVVTASDQEAWINCLTENIQREDLTPLELARAYRAILETFGWQHEDLARRLGISVSKIKHAVRILVLPPEVLEQIFHPDSGLTLAHAEELLALKDRPAQLTRMVNRLVRERWSVDRLRAEIGRPARINRGAQPVHYEDRGDRGFRLHIRVQVNRPQDFPEIRRALERAIAQLDTLANANNVSMASSAEPPTYGSDAEST